MLEVLPGVLPSVFFSPFEVQLFRTAFVLAFFRALQVGELVNLSKLVVGGLDVSDVSVRGDTGTLLIRKSKTDPIGKGARVVLGWVACLALCPVRVIREWVGLRPFGPGPLLIHKDGSALSRYQFVSVFKKCLEVGGFSLMDYSSHSFRIGVATEATRWCLSDQILQPIGCWESHRFWLYIHSHLL